MDTPRIVITGAPASGKTKCFERLQDDERFCRFLFFEELARLLLEEDPSYRDRWAEFHREIYRRQVIREEVAGDQPFISDRGTVDAFAFHPQTLNEVRTTVEREFARYTAVFQLGSAARLGPEYYHSDDVRNESIEEALRIEQAIADVWRDHPGYHFIDATVDFEEKYARAHELIVKELDRWEAFDTEELDTSY